MEAWHSEPASVNIPVEADRAEQRRYRAHLRFTSVNPTIEQHHASACARSTVYRRKRGKRDKNWKQAKYQSAGECLNKLWFNVTIWK